MTHPQLQDQKASGGYSSPLLTVEDIFRLKADYEADVRLLNELPARIELKKRKYDAALLFAPPGFDPDAPSSPAPAPSAEPDAPSEGEKQFELVPEGEDEHDDQPGRVTWIGRLAKLLESADQGMSHQEALTRLKQTPLGVRQSAGDKGFYNAVARLEKRGDLIKNGGLLYSRRLANEMAARGEALPDVSIETRRRSGGSAAAALSVLRLHPDGLDAGRLREELAKLPGLPESLTKHSHYIYNVLSTLMGQGEITKNETGVYSAVREKA